MWQLLSWKKQVFVVAVLAIAIAWAIDTLFEWTQGERANVFKFLSFIATIITVVIAGVVSMFWRWLWQRFPFIPRKTFPDLNGTWEGTLISTWIDPATQQQNLPISTTVWIRQTPFSTSIKLQTGESVSYSTRCLLEADHDAGRFRVWYSYDNLPNAGLGYKSSRHEGVAWLEIDLDAASDQLAGQYYTARRTTGDLAVRRISRDWISEPKESGGKRRPSKSARH